MVVVLRSGSEEQSGDRRASSGEPQADLSIQSLDSKPSPVTGLQVHPQKKEIEKWFIVFSFLGLKSKKRRSQFRAAARYDQTRIHYNQVGAGGFFSAGESTKHC